jgi:hypothetical protein
MYGTCFRDDFPPEENCGHLTRIARAIVQDDRACKPADRTPGAALQGCPTIGGPYRRP